MLTHRIGLPEHLASPYAHLYCGPFKARAPRGSVGPYLRVPSAETLTHPQSRTLSAQEINGLLVATAPLRQGKKPYQGWLIPLVAYAGFRPGDLVLLRASDLVEQDGQWWFNTTRVFGLARLPYARHLPVHPALIAAGWLDFVRQATHPDGFLFPELSRHRGRSGIAPTQWFDYWASHHWPAGEQPRPRVHDVRKTFLAALERTELPKGTLREWAGKPPYKDKRVTGWPSADDTTRLRCMHALSLGESDAP